MAQKTNEQALLGLWFPIYNVGQCFLHGHITAVFDNGRFFLAQLYHPETGKPQHAQIFQSANAYSLQLFVTKDALIHATKDDTD